MSVISDDHVTTICRPGDGPETCRYLLRAPDAWRCAKHTHLKQYLDDRVASGTIHARGDNCPGILP